MSRRRLGLWKQENGYYAGYAINTDEFVTEADGLKPVVMENKDYVEGTNRPQLLLSFYDSSAKQKYLDKQVDNSHMNMMRKIADANREMNNLRDERVRDLNSIYISLISIRDSIRVTDFPDEFDSTNIPYECFIEEIGFQVSKIKGLIDDVIGDVYALMSEMCDAS